MTLILLFAPLPILALAKFCPFGSQARPLRKIFNMVLLSAWTAEPAAR